MLLVTPSYAADTEFAGVFKSVDVLEKDDAFAGVPSVNNCGNGETFEERVDQFQADMFETFSSGPLSPLRRVLCVVVGSRDANSALKNGLFDLEDFANVGRCQVGSFPSTRRDRNAVER